MAGIVAWIVGVNGCVSPPSAAPLMRVAIKAVAQEEKLIDEDARLQQRWLEAQKTSLQRGFESDLRGRVAIDADWVLEGAAAYAAAREMLLRQELGLQAAIETRKQNLQLARQAVDRAIGLMERQDALLEWMPDVRRMIQNDLETRK